MDWIIDCNTSFIFLELNTAKSTVIGHKEIEKQRKGTAVIYICTCTVTIKIFVLNQFMCIEVWSS